MQNVYEAFERGATVLTANARLSRALRGGYGRQQESAGRAVWHSPDVLPWGGWLQRAWREWVATGEETRVLLNRAQARTLWKQVIRRDVGDSLLRIPETARAAMEARTLALAWRIPLDARFRTSEDCEAFLRWAGAYQQRCAAEGWIDEAELPDVLAEVLRADRMARPRELLVAGFERFTTQQESLLNCLGPFTEAEFPKVRATVDFVSYADGDAEISAAAEAAREWLENDAGAQIGIVVPELGTMRNRVERIFRAVLAPGTAIAPTKQPFCISEGRRLSDSPVVRCALLLLEFAQGEMLLSRVGLLLRTPFLEGAVEEASPRACLDAKLRRYGVWQTGIAALQAQARDCPKLAAALRKAERVVKGMPERASLGTWSKVFWEVARAFGWPGEGNAQSEEQEAVQAFRDLLSNLATLDLVEEEQTYGAALGALRERAAEQTLRVADDSAPVQIMSEREAAGIAFDRLWVMGLHDEAWPRAANANPFLPLSAQMERRIPHCSAAVELESAGQTLEHLLESAPEVRLSYARGDGERALEPTSLTPRDVWRREAAGAWEATAWARRELAMEVFADAVAPELPEHSLQKGGSSLFGDMAACPFRAFAKHRLGARELEQGEFGLDPRDKGKLVHVALQTIWTELGSQARLRALSEEETQALVARHVSAALDSQNVTLGRRVEQLRLERLLRQWLAREEVRTPFEKVICEEQREVELGGLAVQLRADRVDVFADGSCAILDYKTGEVRNDVWSEERLDQPQVPLYCATSEREVRAAALVQLQTGNMSVTGLGDAGVLPDFKKMKTRTEGGSVDAEIGFWRSALEDMAERFRLGDAAVDPKKEACWYCRVVSLCRVREEPA